MKLLEVEIKNFLSIKEAKFNFDKVQYPALVVGVAGESGVSNGAGKSALFESIYWCFTGKTVRGVKASEVVSHGMKECVVMAKFEFKNTEYKVERTWSAVKKSLEIYNLNDMSSKKFHDAKEATSFLFSMLNVSPEIFSLISFFGRKFNVFSQMTPKERASIVEVLAESRVYEVARVRAYNDSKKWSASIDTANAVMSSLTESIKGVEFDLGNKTSQLENVKRERSQFMAEAEAEVVEITRQIAEAQSSNSAETQLQECNKILIESEAKIKEIENRLRQEIKVEFEKRWEEITERKRKVDSKKIEITKIESQAQAKTDLLNKQSKIREHEARAGTCFYCNQPIKKETVSEEEIKSLKLEVDQLVKKGSELASVYKREINDCYNEINEFENNKVKVALEKEEKELKEIREAHAEVVAEKNRIEIEWNNWKDENNRLNLKLKDANLKISEGKARFNVERVEGEISAYEKEKNSLYEKHNAEQEKIKQYAEQKEIADYWKVGFKDMRFNSFNGVIEIMTGLVKSYCNNQGLDFDDIEITKWKTSSTGKEIPAIDIIIRRESVAMPIDAMSEGEAQKINIACFLSMAELIKIKTGFNLDTMIFDEPLGGLDYDSRESIYERMLDLAQNKKVFIIDHDGNFQSRVPSVITARKENRVTKIEV